MSQQTIDMLDFGGERCGMLVIGAAAQEIERTGGVTEERLTPRPTDFDTPKQHAEAVVGRTVTVSPVDLDNPQH